MKVSTLFNGLILSFLVILLAASWNYPLELKLLPWVYIFITIILGIIQIISENKKLDQEEDEVRNDLKLREFITNLKGTERGYIKAIVWIMGLLIFLYFFGFLISAPLFTLFYLKKHGESWRFSIGLSLIAWGGFFMTFIYGLNVRMYEGQLYLWIFS